MAAENAIEVSGLTKRYGTVTALDGVSFRVGRGELFGLIGPDGAGKTTLFRAAYDAARPRRRIRRGRRVRHRTRLPPHRERVGYMPGHFSLYPTCRSRRTSRFSPRCSGWKSGTTTS